MSLTLTPESTIDDIRAAIAELEDPRMRAVNEKSGNDYGVNLTKLRAVAKALKTNHDLAQRLWQTGETVLQMLALLICKPKLYSEAELDAMLRQANAPKVREWFISYVLKKNPHLESSRVAWLREAEPVIAAAGWELTAWQVQKDPDLLDLDGLLSIIEQRMKDAEPGLQWAMNNTLAQIGINHVDQRARALQIGERLEVLKDYPTSPGCTSPYAPSWINEMVRRNEG